MVDIIPRGSNSSMLYIDAFGFLQITNYSIRARSQTFGNYAYVPLMDIIPMERNKLGFFGFYFAGLPVWTISFLISVGRSHFLTTALEQIQSTLSPLFSKKWQKFALGGLLNALSLRYALLS